MEHAIEGYMGDGGIMPAKGGRFDLSDQEVENAVVYMLENSKDQ
jgi:cytochrome c